MLSPTLAALAVAWATLAAPLSRANEPIQRCTRALNEAKRQTPLAALGAAMGECAALFVEDGCRKGLEARASVPLRVAPLMFNEVAKDCGEAYCDKLPLPKPALCHQSIDVMAKQGPANWAEFFLAAALHGLSPAASASSTRELRAVTTRLAVVFDDAAKPPNSAFIIELAPSASGLSVSAQGPLSPKPSTWAALSPDLDDVTVLAVVAAAKKANPKGPLLVLVKAAPSVQMAAMKKLFWAVADAHGEVWVELRP